jgi:DNA-binding winged helix-turn-helix (wHTH) protein
VRLRFGPFTIDSSSRQLSQAGRPVALSPKAFDALMLLLERRPNVVQKSELLDSIWPGSDEISEGNLTVVVAEIRRALGDDPHAPRFVRTVHRFGYAFCGDAADVKPGAAPAREDDTTGAVLAWSDQVRRLGEGESLVGRDPGCALWLDVPGVSRRHARIVVKGGTATIEDLGSTNGTFVDDVPVTAEQGLLDGQKIDFGPLAARFRIYSPAVRTEKTSRARRVPRR